MNLHVYHYNITLTHYLWQEPRKYHGLVRWGSRIDSEDEYDSFCVHLKHKYGPREEHIWQADIYVESLNYLGIVGEEGDE